MSVATDTRNDTATITLDHRYTELGLSIVLGKLLAEFDGELKRDVDATCKSACVGIQLQFAGIDYSLSISHGKYEVCPAQVAGCLDYMCENTHFHKLTFYTSITVSGHPQLVKAVKSHFDDAHRAA